MIPHRQPRKTRFISAVVCVAQALVLLSVAAFLFLALQIGPSSDYAVRDYIIENGSRETGAINLVAAIYLGYRAFDTLGETIVLFTAVAGVLMFTGQKKQ